MGANHKTYEARFREVTSKSADPIEIPDEPGTASTFHAS